MNIRREQPEDFSQIRKVHLDAFDTDTEAKIVEALRNSGTNLISLVAVKNDVVIGHILFSPVTLNSNAMIVGLAPMAVVQEWQRRGVGSRLVERGLKICRDIGCEAVVVLGYPEYYSRFGFEPAESFGIESEYDVPPEVFMALELKQGSLKNNPGTVRYHPVFNEV